MQIPTEARATMAAIRDGKSLESYLDDVWERRTASQTPVQPSTGAWPYQSQEAVRDALNASGTNVEPIRKKRSK